MGRAAAWDLARTPGVDGLVVADVKRERAKLAADDVQGIDVKTVAVDLADEAAVAQLLGGVDGAITCADYSLNLGITRAAIRAKTHLVDLGGNMDVVDAQMRLDAEAKAAAVTVIPNSGLAPGMANVLAYGLYARLDSCDAVRIRVGGLPLDRPVPIGYRLLFSVRGLTNEYLEPAEVITGGKRATVESLTEIEALEFPEPFGALEAFHTSGGASLLPRLLEGKVRSLDYKTIRYPGHAAVFHAMSRLGLLSEERPFGAEGPTIREATEAALVGSLGGPARPDVTLVRVAASGTKDGRPMTIEQELIEYADAASGHSAMMRTTSYSAVAMLELVLSGVVARRGVLSQEENVPAARFVEVLARRGISVRERAFPGG